MILTCPACSTRYSVDDASLGATGRSVRCAACGHSWHARLGDSAAVVSPQSVAAVAQPQTVAATPDFGIRGREDITPSATVDVDVATPVAEAAEPRPELNDKITPHAVFRAKQEERKRKMKLAVVGGVWGVVGACLLAGLAAAFLFRAEVVRLWPKSASAFAAVGAPVNPFGLEFEKVRLERQVISGTPVLSISGMVRNATTRVQKARTIELSLLDHKNKKVFSWTVDPEHASLKPGATAKFLTRIANAPVEAMQIEVTLLASAKATSSPSKELKLRRAAPAEAPAAHGPSEEALLAAGAVGEGIGTMNTEGEPFAGHGVAEDAFDPLGAGADPHLTPAPPAGPSATPHG